ncbi:hypothetical protein [Sphingomonas sp. RB1R13]|uniref:hypothetical protein n=1 Tax=Sphingomonas sp. RB1R13 TaxID=3096159 RepID=UPI002FC94DBB
MTPTDAELDRLLAEMDHLRIKLSIARDSGRQDLSLINRLERSVSKLEDDVARFDGPIKKLVKHKPVEKPE